MIYETPERALLRDQVARFVATEVEPHAIQWEASGAFIYHCSWLVTKERDCVKEISELKALTGELAHEVVHACQQFHGGMGYIRATAVEGLWRDVRILAIGGGANEVMLEEAAKRM